MRSANRYLDYMDEQLQQELILLALTEDTLAYDSDDYNMREEHIRRSELLEEASYRIAYLREALSNMVTDY